MRVDLSGIHPLKRLTLILLQFMFAFSITAAVLARFTWMSAVVQTPHGDIGVNVKKTHVLLGVVSPSNLTKLLHFRLGDYDRREPPSLEDELRDQITEQVPFVRFAPMPGVIAGRLYDYPTLLSNLVAIEIHHAWLISITAALYLFARWRIRHTAIRLASEAPGCPRNASDLPDGV